MTAFVTIIIAVAVLLLFVGGLIQVVQWMFWVGIVLLVLVGIVWLVRRATGRKDSSS